MIATTSWASRYSGSFFGWPPRGRHLRATTWVVMVSLPTCEKFSERLLQIGAFSSSLRRGVATGDLRRCKNRGYFLARISPGQWA